MSYKYIVNKAMVNREAAVAEIHTFLLSIGWEYVDGILATPALDIPYADVSIANDTFTKVGHQLVNGDPVRIESTLTVPSGFNVVTRYFVVGVSGDTFKLATSYGGTAINITSQGTGLISIKEASRVYKSNGENSDQIKQFVTLDTHTTTASITIWTSYGYNISTRTPFGVSYGSKAILTNQTGFYLWIWGNKNCVQIFTKVVSTYYRGGFGFFNPLHSLKTTLTSDATAGSSVVLAVADSTGFEVGYVYQIVGINYEGRDDITVTAVGIGTITITSLPRNYGTGSFVGISPLLFGATTDSVFYMTCCRSLAGVADTGSQSYGSFVGVALFDITGSDPDAYTQKYMLQPLTITNLYMQVGSNIGQGGYFDDHFMLSPATGMVIEDTFAVGKLDSGTSSGSNSTSVMNDTTKSWTVNAFANKVVVITFGLGAGQIKKIVSNTATALTLDDVNIFESIPDTTSQYIICDEGYRYMAHGAGTGTAPQLAIREGV